MVTPSLSSISFSANNPLITLLLSCASITLFAQETTETEKIIKQLIIISFEEVWSGGSSGKLLPTTQKTSCCWKPEKCGTITKSPGHSKNQPPKTKKYLFGSIASILLQSKSRGNSVWIAYHNYVEFLMDCNLTRKMHWFESATR